MSGGYQSRATTVFSPRTSPRNFSPSPLKQISSEGRSPPIESENGVSLGLLFNTLSSHFTKYKSGNDNAGKRSFGRMTVVIDLDGRCFRLCTLFWDGSDWAKCLRSLEFWTLGKKKERDKFYFSSMSKFQYWIIITRCSENDNNVVKIQLSVLVFKLNWQDLQKMIAK